MKRSELHYELPLEQIAQRPAEPRDTSRLMVVDRARETIDHCIFRDLPRFLKPGDCLVLNDTRVVPARFFLRRSSGGRVEALFVHLESPAVQTAQPDPGSCADWRVQLKPSARLRPGEELRCEHDDRIRFRILARHARGQWTIRPPADADPWELLNRIGQTPLPPYIELNSAGRDGRPDPVDAEQYQTVYATQPGAVAAPTAGLHFTRELLAEIAANGVKQVQVTLHVGPGTFTPIDMEDLRDHRMHAEYYSISRETLAHLHETLACGGRIVAVGTTSARVLESIGDDDAIETRSGWTDVFIYPPYRFRRVGALITNFHLPGSTLLALVMAFGGCGPIRRAYASAVAERYRFYSYGDAMLIV